MDEQGKIEKALFDDTSRYRDIIDRPRPHSLAHSRMPQAERGAQFSPFAALSGYHQLLGETAKRYRHKKYPSQEKMRRVEGQLTVMEQIGFPQVVRVEYFNGNSGYYEELTGQLIGVDHARHRAILVGGQEIVIQNIRKIARI